MNYQKQKEEQMDMARLESDYFPVTFLQMSNNIHIFIKNIRYECKNWVSSR